ncbi:hypothetical protein AXYL_04052 [Achromobacter xylosoxidans A8]|uniref:DUF6680 domain-containing protein n=1 Tax=Achromobacter xylosoxidans (strain A8) TaxID=762376 RepID=E3HTT2_ACHXA|nr:DUF6680 family protein [Achromobacter xylosoxidans]ADP17372.1 hypothetical protein AXYL_04052 [Achromobacter xylosoxidans A8]
MESSITISDGLIVLATLMGPIFAVQAQQWIERRRRGNERREFLFETLMRTRGARLSAEHVAALNMIDLTYYGSGDRKRTKSEQAVVDAWSVMHHHLKQNAGTMDSAALNIWSAQLEQYFFALLGAIARERGYHFDPVRLQTGQYTPDAHYMVEQQQNDIRRLVEDVLSGKRNLGFALREVETPESEVNFRNEVTSLLSAIRDNVGSNAH